MIFFWPFISLTIWNYVKFIETKLIEIQKKANDLLIKCESSAAMNEQQEQELKGNILVGTYIYTYLRMWFSNFRLLTNYWLNFYRITWLIVKLILMPWNLILLFLELKILPRYVDELENCLESIHFHMIDGHLLYVFTADWIFRIR